jgi:hypothetical protein
MQNAHWHAEWRAVMHCALCIVHYTDAPVRL